MLAGILYVRDINAFNENLEKVQQILIQTV